MIIVLKSRVHVGLAAAVAIGVVIALFPLYADRLAPYMWSYNPNFQEESETTERIHGVVQAVYTDRLTIVVDGKTVSVRGYWVVKTDGVEQELWAGDLLSKYIHPGMRVTVEYKESERWGAVAQAIIGPGFRAESEEG